MSRRNRAIDETPGARFELTGHVDEAAHHRDLARAAVEAVAHFRIGTGTQQALHQQRQAMQRGQVQRTEAARIAHVQADILIQQALHRRHHHLLVAGSTRLGTRTQQQQQRRD